MSRSHSLPCLFVVCLVSSAFLLPERALAQPTGPSAGAAPLRAVEPLAYGASARTIYQVVASGCRPFFIDTILDSGFNYYWYKTAGTGTVDCPINLPSGAKIEKFEVLAHDSSDSGNVGALFGVCETADPAFGCGGYSFVETTGTASVPFTGYLEADLTGLGLVVNKFTKQYYVRLVLGEIGSANGFRAVNVYYRLQVSPAPGLASFGDVPPSHPYFQFIEALAASGVTVGCGGGNYCPARNITRGEMAVFLSKALGLHFPN